MLILGRVLLMVAVVLGIALPVVAQQPIPPPSAWHPFRGGTNCVQVSDAQGNFNCSPLVTINPTTGAFSVGGTSGQVTPVYGALVVAPTGNTFQSLGNEIVLAKALTTTAPAGPGVGAVTLRVRPSPRVPGYCQIVAIAGTAFGSQMEFPLAFQNPSYGFLKLGPAATFTSDYYVVDLPGGPGGC